MNAGMYKAVSGSVAQMRRLEVTTQNLANLNTSGFKGQRLAFSELLGRTAEQERVGGLVAIAEQRTDFSQGELQPTGNDFDLALDGEAFFVIRTGRGFRYTRQGNFTLAPDGRLVNSFGEPVLGEGGNNREGEVIRISGKKMAVSSDGIVRSEEGEVGKLRIVRFRDPLRLTQEGRGLFRAPEGAAAQPAGDYRILQGNLERANVNAVDAMVGLINIHRQFEAYGKVLQMMDSATARMLSEGARL
jgi:flagellar basal-body rod protein FlgF